jgi:glycosyltransferase involved in cell wall biosynthesis
MSRICHFTSVHRAIDTRILLKECQSLAKSGNEVFLVAQHTCSEVWNEVNIIGLQRKQKGRLSRALFFTWRVFFAAVNTRSEVFHFHDPELIPFGLILRLFGKKVIFDIHENIARQIKVKEYLPLRNLVAKLYGLVDWISAKAFFLILAENSYRSIYEAHTDKLETVLNMPDVKFLSEYKRTDRAVTDSIDLFYVGGITFDRGIETVVKALIELHSRGIVANFHCVGPYEVSVMSRVKAIHGFDEVQNSIHFYGPERLDIALQRSENCQAGLSILMPIENYLESYSTKIFEYMAIGLPVITSNFPLYQDVVERYECGYCVDPKDSEELADRIAELANSNELILKFSTNGIRAAESKFNWDHEEEKLLAVYQTLTS